MQLSPTEIEQVENMKTGQKQSDYDNNDQNFEWESYLEETGTTAAPPQSFVHVEHSLETGFRIGMKIEVPNRDQANTYWTATVIMTCGPLLSLRYIGYGDDRSSDFWFDSSTGDAHSKGWCVRNRKVLCPPNAIKEKYKDWNVLLDFESHDSFTIPSNVPEEQAGITPVDQIKIGAKVEIQEENNPNNVWIAAVINNIGGRLLLRYDGADSSQDFWLFYLSDRLHAVGWGPSNNCEYSRPQDLKSEKPKSEKEWSNVLKKSLKEANNVKMSPSILDAQNDLEPHEFKAGMKLEAINPISKLHICPATIAKVFNEYYLLIEIDDYNTESLERITFCCSCCSQLIFPVNWSKENNIKIQRPKGYHEGSDQEFTWEEYLTFCLAEPVPKDLFHLNCENLGFKKGMKIESVNPFSTDQICAATITDVIGPLMWIHLDNLDEDSNPHFIVPISSQDIFPVGWCESNSYPLKPPCTSKERKKIKKSLSSQSLLPSVRTETTNSSIQKDNKKAWCPKIYFNHRCFSGPLLSKGRLAELPKQIGPGSISLVMKEVLTLIINVAYKSSRVLKELQLTGKPDPTMQQQVLKAKYKGKSYRAVVEILGCSDQVEEFCKKICRKLECCPYLFGPSYVGEECPEKCHTLTKTKYAYFSKKPKKVGRPPLLLRKKYELLKGGTGKTQKQKKYHLLNQQRDSESQESSEEKSSQNNSSNDREIENGHVKETRTSVKEPVTTRKNKKYIPPKSHIVTRGAKLPNFSLEMKWRRHYSPFHSKKVNRLAGRPVHFPPRKVGRPPGSTKKHLLTKSKSSMPIAEKVKIFLQNEPPKVSKPFIPPSPQPSPPPTLTLLERNPLNWAVEDVVQYMRSTECAPIARILQEQEVDGQALLLLTLPAAQEFLELKREPAIKLCTHIERIKLAFYTNFVK